MSDSSRSSRRARKEVNYSQFGAAEEDFDDDFADMTPPPGKRQKVAKEPKVKREKKKEKTHKTKPDIHKVPSRKSLDEKVYEREMQLAMELSRQDTSPLPKTNGVDGDDEAAVAQDAAPSSDVVQGDSDAASDAEEMPVLKPVKPVPSKKPTPKSKQKLDPIPDEIEVLEEDVQEVEAGGRRKRRAAAKAITKMVYKDEEEEEEEEDVSDGALEEEEEEEDGEEEEEEDGDSDFEGHWNKNKKKRKGKPKTLNVSHAQSPSKPKPKPRLSATVTPVNKGRGKPILKSSIKLPTEPHHSPVPPSSRATPSGPLVIRKPNWIPSDGGKSPLGGVGVKSPGNLRLGLSKKSRVKPLHASVKIPQ